ncbi:hypothetical protein VSDG_01734 [Cytospora chrysosperma]|uniref:Glycosyl hydrolase family 92 domain-containing protein n=1 Tax=Cytospora chrysosperma TaxID=252740 RepID=A0A423WHY3_CYTCH|nr:hypothetical protein VSDG_01734 [Valsa sordida]
MQSHMTFLTIGLVAILAFTWRVSAKVDYSQYVNPLIGGSGPIEGQAYGGGDIFVGGAVPFGVVKVGIDTYEGLGKYSTLNGGWTPKGNVTAISMMHESGTGGAPKYGIIPQMPLTNLGPPLNVLDNRTYSQRRVVEDTARVGYYSTQLLNGVVVELSGARHSGFIQYSFPAGEKHILVDLSHYLPSETGGYTVQEYLGGSLYINGAEYSGWGTYGAGWNEGAPYTVYFCGSFETQPLQSRTFTGRNTEPMVRHHTFSDEGPPEAVFGDATSISSAESGPLGDRVGAVFSWDNGAASTIKSRVGISFISVATACNFRDDEISTWNINHTVDAAVKEWNEDVFSKIQVATDETANTTNLRLLYSSLYFVHLMPSNRIGENPLWESEEPYWDDFYTMWDMFRCTVSLLHLTQPASLVSMIRSLIDIWRYEGYMPDGRSGNYNGLVQGGSNADNVLADAYVKGLGMDTDDPSMTINWTAGFQAMLKDAEVQPYNTFSPLDQTGSLKEGRGSLYDWIPLGYVSNDSSTRSISKTVEYSLNDYAVSVVAAGEGTQADVEKYVNRSAGWQNLWNHNITHAGFSGFLSPRLSNGDWDSPETYNPAVCAGCEWVAISYEAVPFEYSFVVPHDMETLVQFMGGNDEFERRLDYIFIPNTTEQDLHENGAGITTIMNIGNEPDFATPYLYNYLNKQYKSVSQTRALANQYFHDALYGLPGNSDAGALNSWLIWQMLGLYPIVTQPVYLLESPWFNDINMTIGGNKTLRITSNGENALLGQSGYFVQSIKINGQEWDKNWLNHDDIMLEGGTIEFTVGDDPTIWETGAVPPSPAHRALNPI